MRIIAVAAGLLVAAGSAQASDCNAPDAPGPFLVRVSDQKVPLFYAMSWSTRPPTPRAVSASCLSGRGNGAAQQVSDRPSATDRPAPPPRRPRPRRD
ncbi:hypothetical protein VQH23_14460 [Pararoseomonas sp. SCSIO 73927]|uniref:hypothetical protein n=1 Tax=Pararoseomonas sp. SCSIO 73927 TaxID=3114537 RepID=UPI0030D28E1C